VLSNPSPLHAASQRSGPVSISCQRPGRGEDTPITMLAFEAAGTIGTTSANPMMSRRLAPPINRTNRRMHRPTFVLQRSAVPRPVDLGEESIDA
jgi:hypothetical protein